MHRPITYHPMKASELRDAEQRQRMPGAASCYGELQRVLARSRVLRDSVDEDALEVYALAMLLPFPGVVLGDILGARVLARLNALLKRRIEGQDTSIYRGEIKPELAELWNALHGYLRYCEAIDAQRKQDLQEFRSRAAESRERKAAKAAPAPAAA